MATQKNLGEAVVHVRATVHGMKDLNDLRTALQNFGNGLPGFSGNMARAGNALELASEASRVTLRNMRHLSFAMRDAGRQALGFAAALALGFAPVIIEGARFEQAVADVRSVMGGLREDNIVTAQTMEMLSKEFIRLGEVSEFTNVQVAGAAKSLALAGFSAKELMSALPTVVNLASAAGTDLERTAEIVANIARSFNLEADNFTRVGDILTQTFTNSNTTLESLAETMKILAPTASALGLSLEEAAAAAGLLGDRGIRGTLAGTGLSRAFNQMREEADKFGEALENLGSSFDRIDLRKNTLLEVITEFERIQKISNEDFLSLAEIFDERAARSFINLIQGGADAFEKLLKLNQQAAGVADAIRKIRLDTLAGDFERLKSNFQSLLTEVFELLKPRLREIVQGMLDFLDAIRSVVRENPELIKQLAVIAESLASFAIPIGLLLLGFGKMVAFVSGFFSLGVAISGAQAQFSILNSTLAATTANANVTAGAMMRLRLALIAFRLVSVAVFSGIAVAVGSLIGLKLAEWFRSSAKAANESMGVYRQLNAEVALLAKNTAKATQDTLQRADDIKQAIEILQKGGNLTEKDFKDLDRLKASSQADLSAVQARARAVNATLLNLLEQQEELDNKIQRMQDPGFILARLFVGVPSGLFKAQDELRNLEEQIKKLSQESDRLTESVKILTDAAKKYGQIEQALLQGDENLKNVLDAELARMIEINEEIKNLSVDIEFSQTAEERKSLLDRLNLLEKERDLLETRRELLTPLQGTLGDRDFLAEAGGDVNAALDAFKAFIAAEQEARLELERLHGVAEEFDMTLDDVDKSLTKTAETLREKIQALKDAEKAQLEYLDAAMAVAVAEGNMSDVLRIENLQHQVRQKTLAAQTELIKEANKAQEETIDGLKLEQAEREKNFKDFQDLKRKLGVAAIDKEAGELFQLTGDPAEDAKIMARQKEFIRLKRDELELSIKQTKADWDAEAKKEKEASKKKLDQRMKQVKERDDIEKEVLKSLAGQAKSAKELAYFMMLIHQLEKKREQQLFATQRRAFRSAELLEALERRRRKLEAAGEDTSKIDRLIRRKKNEFLLRDALLRQREKEAGVEVGGTGFDPDTIRDMSLPGLPDSINTALNTINAMFMGAPKLWVDSFLQQWVIHSPRLVSAVAALLSRISLAGGMPVPASSLTEAMSFTGVPATAAAGNILNMTINYSGADPEMKKLREAIRKSLNSAGFTS